MKSGLSMDVNFIEIKNLTESDIPSKCVDFAAINHLNDQSPPTIEV